MNELQNRFDSGKRMMPTVTSRIPNGRLRRSVDLSTWFWCGVIARHGADPARERLAKQQAQSPDHPCDAAQNWLDYPPPHQLCLTGKIAAFRIAIAT
jgi:hypothetical protein